MVTKGIYLFWDKKYEQVIYAGRFTGRERIKEHFLPSRRNVQLINKYVQNHPNRIDSVIFCEFDDISDSDLNQLEIETIALFKLNKYRYPDSHVFNFTDGGEGMSGFKHSEESKKKMSENAPDRSGENNPFYGQHHTEESKKKMSDAKSGENHPFYGEKRPEISKKMSGENNPMYGKERPEISGKNHPNAKYTLWDITKCHYVKSKMFRNGNDGKNPCRCFGFNYNNKYLPIGYHLDFYSVELINDLINESLEVN